MASGISTSGPFSAESVPPVEYIETAKAETSSAPPARTARVRALNASLVFLPDAGLCNHVPHGAANLGNGPGKQPFRHGHPLANASRSRQAAGRQARHRPAAGAPRPVPDGALPGADRGPEPAVRP